MAADRYIPSVDEILDGLPPMQPGETAIERADFAVAMLVLIRNGAADYDPATKQVTLVQPRRKGDVN